LFGVKTNRDKLENLDTKIEIINDKLKEINDQQRELVIRNKFSEAVEAKKDKTGYVRYCFREVMGDKRYWLRAHVDVPIERVVRQIEWDSQTEYNDLIFEFVEETALETD